MTPASSRGKGRPGDSARTSLRSLAWRGHDAHERQARQAATGFAAGRDGLARALTPAPAASLFLPSSLGFPLPSALRADLEAGFAADLGAVRVHADAAAQAAARAAGARAFAAGHRLFFGTGQWSPFSADGRTLIAHEVAHVLQQAGRAGSGGRLRAAGDTAGSAGVQRDPDNQAVEDARDMLVGGVAIKDLFAVLELLNPATGIAAVETVLARHAKATTDAEVAARSTQIRMAMIGKSDSGALAGIRETLAKLTSDQLSDPVRALFRDCFKALGAHDDAVAVTSDTTPAASAFGSWDHYAAKLRGNGSWVLAYLKGHPVAGKYWPNAVVAVARLDFFGPGRTYALNLDPDMKFDATMKDAIANALLYQPLMGGEREAVALRALAAFDSLRKHPFTKLVEETRGKTSLMDRFEAKLNFLTRYQDANYLASLLVNPEPETRALALAAGTLIEPIATKSQAYWRRALDFTVATDRPDLNGKTGFDAIDAAKRARSDALQKAVATRVGGLKPLATLEGELIKAVERACRLEKGGVPAPASLAANLAAGARAVEQSTLRIDGAVARRERKLTSSELPVLDPNSVDTSAAEAALTDDMVYGVVLVNLFRLQHRLLTEYAAPKAATDAAEKWIQRDEALKAYKLAAYRFIQMAELLGFAKLDEAARAIMLGEQAGVTRSQLALLAPFAPDSVPLEELSREFPNSNISNFPVSGSALVQMSYALYYEGLLSELQDVLTVREKIYDPAGEPIVNTAIKQVEAKFKPPQRYRVPRESTLLFVRPQDWDDVSPLVFEDGGKGKRTPHPQFASLTAKLAGDQIWVIPKEYRWHANGFVVWVVSDLGRLAETLSNVPGVSDLERAKDQTLGFPSEYQTPLVWLGELFKLVEAGKITREALDAGVKDWMDASLQAAEGPLRRATNNLRRSFGPEIAKEWNRVNKSFLKDPEAFYDAPRNAMRLTLEFFSGIMPATPVERQTQMALLMLELAPVLAKKLGSSTHLGGVVELRGTERFDIVLPLHPYVMNGAQLGAVLLGGKDLSPLGRYDLGFPVSELAARSSQLAGLAAEFKKTVEDHQAETVMEGLPEEKLLRVPGRGYPLYAADPAKDWEGTSFQLNGNVYQLIHVHRRFSYQPEMLGDLPLVPVPGQPIGVRKLSIDGVEVAPDAPPVDLLTIMYTPHGGKTQEGVVVRSDNVRMLSELAYALHINITMEALGDLADVMNEFASAITAVLQLAFPEFAPAIAAAEIAGSVLRFWASPEFATIKAVMTGDVGEVFAKGLAQIKQDLQAENLWGYLLFDEHNKTVDGARTAFKAAGRVNGMRGRSPDGDDPVKKSSIKRVVGAILGGGGKVADGLMRVHDEAGFAVRKLELGVQSSPVAMLVMRAIARNLYRLDGLTLKEVGIDAAEDAVTGVQDTLKRFEAVLEALDSFELPEELVPLEVIIEMVVNFIIDHLPLKYRVPLQGVRGVISATPLRKLYDMLFSEAADQLEQAGIDPNILWRDHARAELDPYLSDAAHQLSAGAHSRLNKVPFLTTLRQMDVPAVATGFVQGDITPSLDAGHGLPLAPPRLPAGGGAALGGAERAAAQSGFGHDFSHVRLHRGGAVDLGLRAAGARGATAGSHVFLDSGLDTGGPGGRAVLHHELAHVLQQSGPRPLGRRHGANPATPAAGSGPGRWQVDPAAERQADRLAAATVSPAAAPRPVSHAAGLQPSLTDIAARLFRKLGDPTQLVEHAEGLATKAPTSGASTADVEKAAPGLAADLQAKLLAMLDEARLGKGKIAFAEPFDLAKAEIIDYVVNNRKSELAHFPNLLRHALKQVTVKSGGKTSGASTTKAWVLDTGRLETNIEEFFFGRTSVSVDVELKTSKAAWSDGKEHLVVDQSDPFKSFKVNFVHLPMIGGSAALWDLVIENSFPNKKAQRALYQSKARLALLGLQPGPGIFKSSGKKLVLGDDVKKLIEDYVNPPPGRTLPGNLAPTWADYVEPDPSKATQTAGHGQIGLRLGLYGQKNQLTAQKGTDRESHHTVQYLLIEYLVNTKANKKPFPHKLSLYPNITGTGSSVELIARVSGGNAGIAIAANDKGDRGPGMPAILLSKHTHSLGNVHISPKPDDLPGKGASQGSAIHGKFSEFMGAHDAVLRDKKGLEALAARRANPAAAVTLPKAGGADVSDASLATAIHTAACKTYSWMRDDMNSKLQRAIDTHEVAYYKALVMTATRPDIYNPGAEPGAAAAFSEKAAGKDYRPKPAGATIIAKVREQQQKILEGPAFGFENKP